MESALAEWLSMPKTAHSGKLPISAVCAVASRLRFSRFRIPHSEIASSRAATITQLNGLIVGYLIK
jgi:hypothetical protein